MITMFFTSCDVKDSPLKSVFLISCDVKESLKYFPHVVSIHQWIAVSKSSRRGGIEWLEWLKLQTEKHNGSCSRWLDQTFANMAKQFNLHWASVCVRRVYNDEKWSFRLALSWIKLKLEILLWKLRDYWTWPRLINNSQLNSLGCT